MTEVVAHVIEELQDEERLWETRSLYGRAAQHRLHHSPAEYLEGTRSARRGVGLLAGGVALSAAKMPPSSAAIHSRESSGAGDSHNHGQLRDRSPMRS